MINGFIHKKIKIPVKLFFLFGHSWPSRDVFLAFVGIKSNYKYIL